MVSIDISILFIIQIVHDETKVSMYVHISTRGSEGNHSKLLKSSQFFGGINTQFLKFLPSQFPKTNHPNFKAYSWNWYQTLRFLSSILKKHNSLQVLRYNDNAKRDVRPTGGGEKRFAWSISSMAPRMRCLSQVMQCPAKLWPQVVERGGEILPRFQKISTRCFPAVSFFKEAKKHKTTPGYQLLLRLVGLKAYWLQ